MINKSVYQVEMSTDGKHRVIVTIEDPAGTDAALAWARATHAKLVRDGADAGSKLAEHESPDETPPICAMHDVPMVRVQSRKGPFWSCHEKNEDGGWCSYRPK